MAIPNTGRIEFEAIGGEFNDEVPHSLSEFYRLLGPAGIRKVTEQNTNVPTSGEIKFSDFYGTSRQPKYQTEDFTSQSDFTVPAEVTNVEVLVVGGGGSGGNNAGGGGGGGGVAYNAAFEVSPGSTYQATIAGAGGQSNFSTLSANAGSTGGQTTGGGGAGGTPGPGGSGGGGGPTPGSNGIPGQPGPTFALGQYGGGGGGGGYAGSGAAGGNGGGGTGSPSGGAQAGATNTGGGGGGGYSNWQGGASGGTGRVLVRYAYYD